MFLLFILCYL